jgi:WAS protein family, member 3
VGYNSLLVIFAGIELRKVETRNDVRADEKPSSYHDVASILARRVAVEMSDSDSGSTDDDSDGWDETSA